FDAHLLIAANVDVAGFYRTVLHNIRVFRVFQIGRKAAKVRSGFVHHGENGLGGGGVTRSLCGGESNDRGKGRENGDSGQEKSTIQMESPARMDSTYVQLAPQRAGARCHRSIQEWMREPATPFALRMATAESCYRRIST